MNMNVLQGIIMGFVSGLSELLPISAEGHRSVLRILMGIDTEDAVFRLVMHLFTLIALLWCSRAEIAKLRRSSRLMKIPVRRRKHQPDMPAVYTIRLLRIATVVMVLCKLFTASAAFIGQQPQFLAFAMIGNGILLLIPSLVRSANKDSRNMPRLDGFLMGLGAGLSVIPGISLVGASASIGMARGVDRKYALQFAYLLLIPGMVIQMVFDVIAIATGGAAVFSGIGLLTVLLGGIACYAGCLVGQRIMKFVVFSTNFSSFSYYCWVVGLFTFVLFLVI